jgi:Xaa-Pro aminopeptidase
MNRPETLLMVADSERDANMLYATGLFVGDPFIYLNLGRGPLIVLSDLEIDRARKQAPHCRVVSLSAYQQKLRGQKIKRPSFPHVIREIFRENKIRRAIVPDNFPLGLAKDLKKLGIKLKPSASFFPKREIKSARPAAHVGKIARGD